MGPANARGKSKVGGLVVVWLASALSELLDMKTLFCFVIRKGCGLLFTAGPSLLDTMLPNIPLPCSTYGNLFFYCLVHFFRSVDYAVVVVVAVFFCWLRSQGAFAQLALLEGHARAVTSLISTASNGMLWSSSEDGTIRIWNTATNTCEHTITSENQTP